MRVILPALLLMALTPAVSSHTHELTALTKSKRAWMSKHFFDDKEPDCRVLIKVFNDECVCVILLDITIDINRPALVHDDSLWPRR